jgi:hypothetical protein
MSKPVIVIVPGAWHRPRHYHHLNEGLEPLGYEAIGVTMPSVDSHPPHPSWDQDAAAVREVITKQLDAGRDVVVVAHSFGGVAMSEAVKGLGKKAREEQGLKGGVVRLVYMTAMAMPAGQNYVGQLAPKTPEEEAEAQKKEELNKQVEGIKYTEVCFRFFCVFQCSLVVFGN